MTNDDQSNQSATSPTNSEAVRSGDWLGEPEPALVPEVERGAGAEPDYCEICGRYKTEHPDPDQRTNLCCCRGIQPYAMSCYPGEHKLVRTHPANSGKQWYRREDVDAILEGLEAGRKSVDSEPRRSPSGAGLTGCGPTVDRATDAR